ncbi:DUF5362 domain-containing protein [Coralloluteibacterium thermophilus]|uniref:DUF5362 domain-containing protein n=1 Tax=Coralloluteibacterium thermophilum TaxID=2707049 RepID=A0ABV9NEE3_9GAMM
MISSESAVAPRPGTPSVAELARPLAAGKGWLKFVGIMFIVQGALTALSIVGILIAWLPIWIGVLVMQSANAIEEAVRNDDAAALRTALSKLRTYFVIQGVLFLVGLALIVLYVFVFGAAMLAMFGQVR